MPELAWAAETVEANYDAILSECGGSFDRAHLLAWVEEYGVGYFLRDHSSPLDCLLFEKDKFHLLYSFERGNEGAMFRVVVKN